MTEEQKRRRATPEVRAEEIIQAALTLAAEQGYMLITREQIAQAAGCSPALVGKYFGEMRDVREHIMRAAVDCNNSEVVLQGIATRHPIALAAPKRVLIAAKNRLDLEL